MKKLLILLVPMLAITFGGSTTLTQTRIEVPAGLTARAAAGEMVNVIVGVNAGFVPEGFLAGPAAVADQRDSVAQVLDDVMGRAVAVGAIIGTRFDYIPFFSAQVSRAALEALATMPGVASISEDGVSEPTLAQSVPIINAPAAWAAGATGAGWRVAVLDTGVETGHSFIGNARVYSEACYSGAGGGTNQSNCPGGVTSSTAAGSATPCVGVTGCDHGTHVAGIALGATSGGAGVAPNAQLIAVQVFTRRNSGCSTNPCLGAYDSNIISGLNRVFTLAGASNVNQVASVNMSLGGGNNATTCDAQNPAMTAAINNLRSIGVATVVSSGNDAFASSMSYPACISTAVSVGATNKIAPYDIAGFSNDAPFLSLAAPGVNIISSVVGNAFGSKSGTSMAAPHVAGAWAIIKQAAPSVSVTDALAIFRATGTTVLEPFTGRTQKMINVNAARLALAGGTSLPGVPTNFAVTVNGNNISLSWGPPASGGAPTGYALVVNSSPIGATTAPIGNVLGFAAAVPNGAYNVSVLAYNGVGAGPASGPLTFNVPTLPAAPGIVTGLVGNVSGSTVSFTWNAPASGGAVANYVLQAGLSPGFTTPIVSTPLPPSPTAFATAGVPPGTYYVRVFAQNAGGNSPAYSNEVSVTVAGPQPPGTPTLNAPTVVGNTVNLSWTPGGGGAPTSYLLAAASTPGGAPFLTAPIGGTSASFPGVPSGTYYLRIAAVNALGTSLPSNEVMAVVP